jgi:DNA-binding MarR family transcriptional regulator/nitroimidazol reductase NimA-like FMN-containing flavoprotein (pyridoxamine 5'-phosphate oxidase superfamily)
LTPSECATLLREGGWGVIAVAERSMEAAIPVGTPTAYAYDGRRVFLAMSTGRKLRALLDNPHLCLTVADVRSASEWRSVALIGRVRWIAEASERAAAIATFAAQPRRGEWRLDPPDAAALARGHIAALDADELHGYASGADSRAIDDAPDAAIDTMNALRRVVRSLRMTEISAGAALGVTTAQLFVLREVGHAGRLTIGELARRTATAQSTVSEVVARLATRKLLVREPSKADRRRVEISLTDSGRALLDRAPETIQERLLSAFGRLPPGRRREIAEGMRVWMEEADLAEVAPTMLFEPLMETI